jgi:hypothetical protein
VPPTVVVVSPGVVDPSVAAVVLVVPVPPAVGPVANGCWVVRNQTSADPASTIASQ